MLNHLRSNALRIGAVALAVFAAALAMPRDTYAAPFPLVGDDIFSSMGQFRVRITNPAIHALTTGCPGYNSVTQRLESPILHDTATRVGRSSPHIHGSVTDLTTGATVGTDATNVKDSDFVTMPPGFQGPAGEREVHTEIRDFLLSFDGLGMLPTVKAGTDAPTRPRSVGEVESKATGVGIGDPAADFPAESFFDVFVQVEFLECGGFTGPGTTLVLANPPIAPMLVQNSSLTLFPPHVVYIHGSTPAVPVVFLNDGDQWNPGDLFGYLVLAGHGADFDAANPAHVAEFQNVMNVQSEMSIAAIGGVAEQPEVAALPSAATASGRGYTFYILGAAVALVLAAAGAAGWRKRRA